MLLVRLVGRDGDGTGTKFADVLHHLGLPLFAIQLFKRRERSGETLADSHSDNPVRNDVFGEYVVGVDH